MLERLPKVKRGCLVLVLGLGLGLSRHLASSIPASRWLRTVEAVTKHQISHWDRGVLLLSATSLVGLHIVSGCPLHL